MALRPRSEMRKLIWAFTIPVLLLVAIIIGFFLIDGMVTTNNNAKRTKQLLIDQTVQSYKRMGENFQSMNFSLDVLKQFNPDVVNSIFRGDTAAIYGLVKSISMLATPTEYVGILVNKYIRKPVENLNTTAREIAAGTFQGEVVVDPDSDFAALQGLLKSGRLILRKFDEKMDEKI